MLMLLIRTSSSVSIKAESMNTQSSKPTSLDTSPNAGVTYLEHNGTTPSTFATLKNIFGLITRSPAILASQLRLFNKKAEVQCSKNDSIPSGTVLVLRNLDEVVTMSNTNGKVRRYKADLVGGICSLAQTDDQTSVGRAYSTSCLDESSSIIFTINPNGNILYSMDTAGTITSNTLSLILQRYTTNNIHITSNGQYLLFPTSSSSLVSFIEKSTRTLVADINQPQGCKVSLINNLKSSELYRLDLQSNVFTISDLSNIPVNLTVTSSRSVSSISDNYIINFGSNNFVGILDNLGQLIIFSKQDLTPVQEILRINQIASNIPMQFTLMGSQDSSPASSHFGIVSMSGLNINFQTFQLLFDKCAERNLTTGACTKCIDQYYLVQGGNDDCVLNNLAYRGLDTQTGLLTPCLVQMCSSCTNDYKVCDACNPNYTLVNNTCTIPAQVVASTTCTDTNCRKCDLKADECTECFTGFAMNSSLEQNRLCKELRIFNLQINREIEKCSVGFRLAHVSTQVEIPEPKSSFYSKVNQFLLPVFQKNEVKFTPQVFKSYEDSGISICITQEKDLSDIRSLTIEFNESISIETDSFIYIIYLNNQTISLPSPSPSQSNPGSNSSQSSPQQSFEDRLMQYLTGSNIENNWYKFLLAVTMTLDPSGLLIKVFQLTKLVTKLKYANVKYSPKLDDFICKLKDYFLLPSIENKGYTDEEYHTKNYRGKLSMKHLSTDFIYIHFYTSFIYITLFITHYMSLLGLKITKKLSPCSIYMIYLVRFIKTQIYNILLVDYIFYGSRLLLHGKNHSPVEYTICALILLALSMDSIEVLSIISVKGRWQYMYYLRRVCETAQNSNRDGDERVVELTGRIDYAKTFDRLEQRYDLLIRASSWMRVDSRIFGSGSCRLASGMNFIRIWVYTLSIVCFQFESFLALSFMLSIDVINILLHLYIQIRYRAFQNILRFLMGISQSLLLVPFFIICRNQRKTQSEEKQTTCIWLIIAACLCEYIMILNYITLSLSSPSTNRKQKEHCLSSMVSKKSHLLNIITYITKDKPKQSELNSNHFGSPLLTENSPLRTPNIAPLNRNKIMDLRTRGRIGLGNNSNRNWGNLIPINKNRNNFNFSPGVITDEVHHQMIADDSNDHHFHNSARLKQQRNNNRNRLHI